MWKSSPPPAGKGLKNWTNTLSRAASVHCAMKNSLLILADHVLGQARYRSHVRTIAFILNPDVEFNYRVSHVHARLLHEVTVCGRAARPTSMDGLKSPLHLRQDG